MDLKLSTNFNNKTFKVKRFNDGKNGEWKKKIK